MDDAEKAAAEAQAAKAATEAAAKEAESKAKAETEKAAADAATKKAADEKSAADKVVADAKAEEEKVKAAKNEVPESYDLKLSENSPLSDERLKEVAAYAKETKLTLGQAEALVQHQEFQEAAYRKRTEGWLAEITADKEIGGDKAARSIELAKRVTLKYGDPELVKLLESSKLGEEPRFVKLMSRIGRAYGEDSFFASPNPSGSTKEVSRAEAFYGKPKT